MLKGSHIGVKPRLSDKNSNQYNTTNTSWPFSEASEYFPISSCEIDSEILAEFGRLNMYNLGIGESAKDYFYIQHLHT
jgi:hypothetical protein